MTDPKTHTMYFKFANTSAPIVTGASVIGVKYNDGIMLCADTQASYGSSRKFKGFCRIAKINDKAAISNTSITHY